MERRPARRRPNHIYWPCTRERAGPRREPLLAPPRSPQDGDKVRAETIARCAAICRTVAFLLLFRACSFSPVVSLGGTMTVYLISLALAGLVAVVVWESFA